MAVYYNEWDKFCAQWLRNLIAAGHLPAGDVDERSIADVRPDDLQGYDQCHFFAGIGGWPLALRLAGWSGPVWTGSCPCQPLSSAGKRQGELDARHLWPVWAGLIAHARPPTVFGEQVASSLGREWFAGVRADMEDMDYAIGGADLCVAGVGAPHIRQRLWWVADSNQQRELRGPGQESSTPGPSKREVGGRVGQRHGPVAVRSGAPSRMGNACGPGLAGRPSERSNDEPQLSPTERTGDDAGGLGNANGQRRDREPIRLLGRGPQQDRAETPWSRATRIVCADGKARRIEPTIFPLAARLPGDVGQLRAGGNAICPQVAAEFVTAFMECRPDQPMSET